MATAERPSDKGATPTPQTDDLEKALGAAAEAGAKAQDGGDIAAADAGASKLSLDVDRERKLPTGHPPRKGDD